jgi:ABC-type branched-subunit amino acid transport system substrate-binding protein
MIQQFAFVSRGMLPSIALLPKETAFYPLYYSRGVALEADVLAKHLRNQEKNASRRLVQVYRDDEVGRGAAQALTEALRDSGIQVESRVLPGQQPSALNEALKDISSEDALML